MRENIKADISLLQPIFSFFIQVLPFHYQQFLKKKECCCLSGGNTLCLPIYLLPTHQAVSVFHP